MPIVKPYVPPITFSGKVKERREEEQSKLFLESLETLPINIPFVDALKQTPYLNVRNTLADLGASISVMPLSMFKRLGLRNPKHVDMLIERIDKSMQAPKDIVENVQIKIDKFIFPVDFVILDIVEDDKNYTCLGLRKKYCLSLKNDMLPQDKMENQNITMEEYIMLEEEKYRRHGKVYNWETAKYGKICVFVQKINTAYSDPLITAYGSSDTIIIIRARITSIKVNGKNAYELKGKFLDDLHNNAFSGTNGEDAVEHIEYFLRIVDPIDLPNVNQDKLRVLIFPISLVGDAWKWFDEIKGSINRMNSMMSSKNLGMKMVYLMKLGIIFANLSISKMGELNEDGFCNGGELPGMVRVGYMAYFQDHEWYNDLMDGSSKDEALEQKAIYEESWGDAKQSVINFCKWLRKTFRNFHELDYGLLEKLQDYWDDKEYVAIKEDEYDDLTSTSEEAIHAYQEIFRMMDEG
ncbi:retrovirus-related pol polyprotein from transposon TNT 1-94 [Tanacetum coccineum]